LFIRRRFVNKMNADITAAKKKDIDTFDSPETSISDESLG